MTTDGPPFVNRWAVLIRGINVGGANRLPMAELRASLADAGFGDVGTYVQSGNVALTAAADLGEGDVTERVARTLVDRHGLTVPVVARRADALGTLADRHPDAGGDIDDTYLHVIFLDREPDGAGGVDRDRYEPDTWQLAGREIFVTYPNGSGRSKLGIDVFERAWGVTATARNLNTVRRLHRLCAG